MAILELVTLTDATPHYSIRTQLEGVDYEITLRYGERREGWVLDVTAVDSGVDVLRGQLVTCGRDFLRRCRNITDCPPGQLWALNVSPPNGDSFARPGLSDLGSGGRCRLYYTESDTGAES